MTDIDTSLVNLKLCECYEITTSNSLVARWTNYVSDLTFLGQTYQAIPIWRSEIAYHVDLEVDKVDVFLGLVGITVNGSSYTIPQAIRYGYLRNAHVKIYLVDYSDASIYRLIFEGWATGDISYNKGIVTIPTGSILDKLNDNFPKMIYSEYCNLALFSSYCGLNANDYDEAGTATAGTTTSLIYASIFAFSNHAEGYWEKGKVTMSSGSSSGVSRTIVKHYDGYVKVLLPFPAAVVATNTFTAWPGCDKLGSTCADKFNNYPNFFGFEYIPRPETLYE